MSRLRLAAPLEGFGLPFRAALDRASRLALDGVRLDAAGQFKPEVLSATGRRELKALFRTHELELTALACPMRRGLDDPAELDARLARIATAFQLASDLDCRRVLIQLAPLPAETEVARTATLRDALSMLSGVGDRTGASVVLIPAAEEPTVLRAFVESFDSGGLMLQFDPATTLSGGHDLLKAVQELAPRVGLVQARDGRRGATGQFREDVLGQGAVDWPLTLAALESANFHGHLVVERESGSSRARDLELGLAFLRPYIPPPRRIAAESPRP